jgi:hypothetical protein
MRIDLAKGATFPCPKCARDGLKAYDTEEKTWRHTGLLSASRVPDGAGAARGVPRAQGAARRAAVGAAAVGAPRCCSVALVMAMVPQMPVNAVAALVGEQDMRIWRVVHHYVHQAVEAQSLEGVRRVGLDEKSSRRGHELRDGVRGPQRCQI